MGTQEVAHDTELLSVRRAARRLGIARGTLYRLVSQGRVPAHRVGGSIRIDPDELDRWLEERRTG